MAFKVPSSTTTNATEFKPDRDAIGFAPELVDDDPFLIFDFELVAK